MHTNCQHGGAGIATNNADDIHFVSLVDVFPTICDILGEEIPFGVQGKIIRPQLVRPNWLNLNGEWGFRFDDENIGAKENWKNGFTQTHKILVPFTYETEKSGIADQSVHNTAWYQRTVDISECTENKTLLHFEGSDYHTKVWVNGEPAGENTGGYSRFSFDITNIVASGKNIITVQVKDSLLPAQVRGKQRWQKENFGCWYVQTTGIWKTVWLENVPEQSITNLKLTPNLEDQSLTIEADISGDSTATLCAKATFEDIFIGEGSVTIKNGKAAIKLDVRNTAIDEWGVKTWSPESPALYDLELTLVQNGAVLDTVNSYFGMRSIEIHGKEILLNGQPYYQKLILDQGYWQESHLTPPNEEALIKDIDKIQQLGYNGLRKHQKTEDERFLYWCDVKGMLLWCEMPSMYEYSDNAASAFTEEWLKIVKQNYNHPCVITWVPMNESWGVPQVRVNKKQQQFTQAIYYITKAIDSTRPVIVNDGWEHTISDIITLHDYQESGDAFFEKYSCQIDEILANEIPHCNNRFTFANGFGYKGQPIFISEYGGIAFTKGEGWGYGNKVSTEKDFLGRFASITRAIQKLPFVSGYCYTQVTDVQQEVNGLMYIDRSFKVDAKAICAINKEKEQY